MDKIPFDIKYRPEIEAGKYEVVNRLDTPVKILCYDARGKYPIAGLVRGEETDSPQSWCIDGSFDGRNESLNDLFLVPAERELTAFESRLCEILDFAWKHKDTIKTDGDIIGDAKRLGPELLALAREELQPEIDTEIAKAYKNADSIVYENGVLFGRTEALKDLPRWKKAASAYDGDRLPRIDWSLNRLVARFEEGIFYLDIRELYKLPGFKED